MSALARLAVLGALLLPGTVLAAPPPTLGDRVEVMMRDLAIEECNAYANGIMARQYAGTSLGRRVLADVHAEYAGGCLRSSLVAIRGVADIMDAGKLGRDGFLSCADRTDHGQFDMFGQWTALRIWGCAQGHAPWPASR